MTASRRSVVPLRGGHLAVPAIYADLRDQIVSIQLEPGASLSEVRIAELYGVSRTPVREAFKRLADDGLLDVVPQVGSFVARIDLRRVRDNHFIRETLECRIVEQAATRIDASDRKRLLASLASQTQAAQLVDPTAFFRADEAMHEMLAQIAGYPSAWQVIHAAKTQLDRVRRLSMADAARLRKTIREHRRVIERVCAGDGAGAVAAMHEHLDAIFDTIAGVMVEHARYFIGMNDDQGPSEMVNLVRAGGHRRSGG